MKKQSLAKTLKALSDPTRLRIFDMLMGGMHCNCEISEQLDLSLSLVSHHLRILREVGLVQGQRDPNDARWIHYSVNQNALAELNQSLSFVERSYLYLTISIHAFSRAAGMVVYPAV